MITLTQVGCGYWGPNLLRNFSTQPDCLVKWVAEQSPERRKYVEQHFPKSRTSAVWQDCVNDPSVDAVVIATPASTHFGRAKAALQGGKHVFVEKPLAMNTREADELIELAATAKRTLMVGHT